MVYQEEKMGKGENVPAPEVHQSGGEAQPHYV
jgi:hypothetical protein